MTLYLHKQAYSYKLQKPLLIARKSIGSTSLFPSGRPFCSGGSTRRRSGQMPLPHVQSLPPLVPPYTFVVYGIINASFIWPHTMVTYPKAQSANPVAAHCHSVGQHSCNVFSFV